MKNNEIALRQSLPVADMLRTVIDQGITTQSVEALGKLADLYERMQAKEAEQQFAAAFAALQAQLPVIVASSVIPNRGKYERFEDVMARVGPLLSGHGFSVSFDMESTENRIRETCTLRHAAGHSQRNSFTVRIGGKADSDTQADCKAATTAKRNALLNALNIVIRQDCLQDGSDAGHEGAIISPEQADDIARRVAELNIDRDKFLKFAGAKTFAEIPSGKFGVLDAELLRRERTSGK